MVEIREELLPLISEDIYRLCRAADEYSMPETLAVTEEEIRDSKAPWRILNKLEPYVHQVKNLVSFCRRLPAALIADDVGLGKTISAGLIISEMMIRKRISRTLVVCPGILMEQWAEEELKNKFGLKTVCGSGREAIRGNLEMIAAGEADIMVTTYEGLRDYHEIIAAAGFDLLVLDEAHKLRNHYGTPKQPKTTAVIHILLERKVFSFVLMLTATPIHNRLWDIYSLIDFMAVCRGHRNPLGTPEEFSARYVADQRRMRVYPERKQELQNVVRDYMRRTRRQDVNLPFPAREVRQEHAIATPVEQKLLAIIQGSVRNGVLKQCCGFERISIYRALMSSPQALAVELLNKAEKNVVFTDLAEEVAAISRAGNDTAKLLRLLTVIEAWRKNKPHDWRMVIFTIRRETQKMLVRKLADRGISCGVINGETRSCNPETLHRFRAASPEINVIVSTDAGAEGINLQVCNVVVNYDLDWNPMKVEQRIGRVQRLGSQHKFVAVLNLAVQGTVEELVVQRLAAKMQMVAATVGDVESILDTMGCDDDDHHSFEDLVSELVDKAMQGENVEQYVRQQIINIGVAKEQLREFDATCDEYLGSTYAPGRTEALRLKRPASGMPLHKFVQAALHWLGQPATEERPGVYRSDFFGSAFVFDEKDEAEYWQEVNHITPGSKALAILCAEIGKHAGHAVRERDRAGLQNVENAARTWVEQFGGTLLGTVTTGAQRAFSGAAHVRVRVSNQVDSYENIVEVPCLPNEHHTAFTADGVQALSSTINAAEIGVQNERLAEQVMQDPSVCAFTSFYGDRLREELPKAGRDENRRKRITADLQPQTALTLEGVSGEMQMTVEIKTTYMLGGLEYLSKIRVSPSQAMVVAGPRFERCAQTGRDVPEECLAKCVISGAYVRRDLLQVSAASGRLALPAHTVTCDVTGLLVLSDEVVTTTSGAIVRKELTRTSAVSGTIDLAERFTCCAYTKADILKTDAECSRSDYTGKLFRRDEERRSGITGKNGHCTEMVQCAVSKSFLHTSEANRCEETGKYVAPRVLQKCGETGKWVLPELLALCAETGVPVLKRLLVECSITRRKLLQRLAVRSRGGKYCCPGKACYCFWTGGIVHPVDAYICTGSALSFSFLVPQCNGMMNIMCQLLAGARQGNAGNERWQEIGSVVGRIAKGDSKVVAAERSPDGRRLVVCLEIRRWLFRRHYLGMIYDLETCSPLGDIIIGRRDKAGWQKEGVYRMRD